MRKVGAELGRIAMIGVLRRLEPAEEQRFRADYAVRSIPFVRTSLPIAVGLYLLFLTWDYTASIRRRCRIHSRCG